MKHLLGGLTVVAVVVAALVIGRADRTAQAAPGDTIADLVYGQFGSFTTGNQNCYTNTSINADSLCAPNGITIDKAGRLWIADTGNHRVLEYDTPLTNTTAQRVFGQGGSFTTGIPNNGGLSANSLNYPTGVARRQRRAALCRGRLQSSRAGVRHTVDECDREPRVRPGRELHGKRQ